MDTSDDMGLNRQVAKDTKAQIRDKPPLHARFFFFALFRGARLIRDRAERLAPTRYMSEQET